MKKEQRKREALLIASCALIVMAFTIKSDQHAVIDLETALKEGKIAAGFQSTGTYHGQSVSMNLKSNLGTVLKVKIPAGTLFISEDKGEQELVTVTDQIIVLQPRSQQQQNIYAYCSEASDRCPADGGKFSFKKSEDAQLRKLLGFLKTNKVSEGTIQDAVWAVTDRRPVSNIDYQIPADKELRKFVASMNGQSDPWYSTPQQRNVRTGGEIVSETVIVKGDLSFTCNKGAVVYQEIVKKDGTLMHKSNKTNTVRTGNVDFSFSLKVMGWERGEYSLKVKDGSQVLAEYPFRI
jgi:NAD(P)H-dependent FMN reductase